MKLGFNSEGELLIADTLVVIAERLGDIKQLLEERYARLALPLEELRVHDCIGNEIALLSSYLKDHPLPWAKGGFDGEYAANRIKDGNGAIFDLECLGDLRGWRYNQVMRAVKQAANEMSHD